MENILVYDLEIIKAIPTKNQPQIKGIEYANGWTDHANMGVSVICAYDFLEDRYRVFTQDNWDEFVQLASAVQVLAGFNSISFDNAVLKACGIVDIPEEKCYDLLREIWAAAGLGSVFKYSSHAGYGLDAVAIANGLDGKTGNGALAPVDWQRGNIGKVIDYCLQDTAITAKLIKMVRLDGRLKCPKTGEWLDVKPPMY